VSMTGGCANATTGSATGCQRPDCVRAGASTWTSPIRVGKAGGGRIPARTGRRPPGRSRRGLPGTAELSVAWSRVELVFGSIAQPRYPARQTARAEVIQHV
jgi:hypothetical protein